MPYRQAITEVDASHAERVGYAHLVLAVGGRIEDQPRITAKAGTAVVVFVMERERREAVRRKRDARRMHRHLVHRRAIGVMRRRRVEVADALSLRGEEIAIGV